jgi:hypothetical protein
MRRWYWFLLVPFLGLAASAAQTTVSFDGLFSGPGEYIEDVALADEAATFRNTTYESWGSWYWAGFAWSTMSNTVANSYTNQYAAAQGFPRAYAVAYDDGRHDPPEIAFALPCAPKSVLVDNTTYAALTIRDGDEYGFSQPFASNDTFVLTLTAYDVEGHVLAATNHYLADYRDGNTFVQTNWSQLDLSWMPADVVSLVGTLETTDVGDWGPNTPMYFALADFTYAYDDASRGVAASNAAILCWATGWTNYAPGTNVEAQWQVPSNAVGRAQGSLGGLGATNGVVPLGDDGSVVLTFPAPIADGPGPDFAVFENAFSDAFLELAFVEVSSDGDTFVRFPTHCLETNWIDTYGLTNATDPTAYGGFAGKHVQGTGTPFDLKLLAGTPGLDVRRVTHVRIVDVKGDGSNSDTYGNPVFDPHPTFGSGGFDLDAVGVLNANLDISADPAGAAPALPGYETVLEYTPTLAPPAWRTNDVPAQGAPGFFRWRLVK